MKIPEQYLPVMPYIITDDANGFLNFTKKVFGGAEKYIMPGDNKTVRHGELRIGDAVIMFAQSLAEWPAKPCGMFMYVEDVDAVFERAMDEGAHSIGKPEKKDYGYTAGFQDPYDNQWWIVQ